MCRDVERETGMPSILPPNRVRTARLSTCWGRLHDATHIVWACCSTGRGTPSRPARWLLPVVVATVFICGVAAACALAEQPIAWLVLTVIGLAVALDGPVKGLTARIPLASLVLLSGVGGVLLIAGLLRFPVLHSAGATTALLVGVDVATVAAAWRLGKPPGLLGTRGEGWSALGYLPFGLMCTLAVAMSWGPPGGRLGWFLSGDHLRHVAFVTRLWDSGALEYESQSYPRGWHALVATAWASTGPERDAASLESLVALHAAMAWLSAAALVLALGVLGITLHRRVGGRPAAWGLSGALAGALALGPQFFGDHVPRGFQTSIVAALVLVVVVTEVVEAPGALRTLVTAAMGLAVLSHLWQLLLPTAVVLALWAVVTRWRARPPRLGMVGDAAILGLAGVFAVPGILGAVRGYGVAGATESGDVPDPAYWWLALVLAAVLWTTVQRPDVFVVAAGAVIVTLGTAAGIVWSLGVPWAAYYPNKITWVAVVLGLPVLAVATVLVLGRMDLLPGPWRTTLVAAGALVGLVTLGSAAAPVLGVRGDWATADGELVMQTVTSPRAPEARVVWELNGRVDDATSQLLLDFYTAIATSPPLGLAATTVDEQCGLLSLSARPVVLSAADQDAVRERFPCAPAVQLFNPGRTG